MSALYLDHIWDEMHGLEDPIKSCPCGRGFWQWCERNELSTVLVKFDT